MEHQYGYIFMYFNLQLHLYQTQIAQRYWFLQRMKFIHTQVTLSQCGGSFKFCVGGRSCVLEEIRYVTITYENHPSYKIFLRNLNQTEKFIYHIQIQYKTTMHIDIWGVNKIYWSTYWITLDKRQLY
jgi:hypothetical protein